MMSTTRKRKANSLRKNKRKVGKRDDGDSVLSERKESEIAHPCILSSAQPPTPPPAHPPTPPPAHPPTPPPVHPPTLPQAHPPTPPVSPLTKECTPKSQHHSSHLSSVTPPSLTYNPHFCTPSQCTPLNLTVTYDYHQSFDERDSMGPMKPIEDVIELFRFKDSPKGRLSAVGVWRDLGSSPALEGRRNNKTCHPHASCSQLQRLQDLATQLDACVADCKGKLDMDSNDVINEGESNVISKQGRSPCVKGNSPVIDGSSGATVTLKVEEHVTSDGSKVVMSDNGKVEEEEEKWEDDDCLFWTQAADIVDHWEHSPSTRKQFEVESADAFIDQLLSGEDQWETPPRPNTVTQSQGLGSSNNGVKRAGGSDDGGRASNSHVPMSIVQAGACCTYTVVGNGEETLKRDGVGEGNHSGGCVPTGCTVSMASAPRSPAAELNVSSVLRSHTAGAQLSSCTYSRPVTALQPRGSRVCSTPAIGAQSTEKPVSVVSGGHLNTRQVDSGQATTGQANRGKSVCCNPINPVGTTQSAGSSQDCNAGEITSSMTSKGGELENGHLVKAVAASASSWPCPPQSIANSLITGTTRRPVQVRANNSVITGAGSHYHGNAKESQRDTMRLKDRAKGPPKCPPVSPSVAVPEKLPLIKAANMKTVSLLNSMPPQANPSQFGCRQPGVRQGTENCSSLMGKAVSSANCSTYYQCNNRQGPHGSAMILRERKVGVSDSGLRKGGSSRCSQDEIEKKRQQAKLRLSQRRQNHTLSS